MARVYAWCRYTDDLVDADGVHNPEAAESALDSWLRASKAAYQKALTAMGYGAITTEIAEAGPFDTACDWGRSDGRRGAGPVALEAAPVVQHRFVREVHDRLGG